VAKDSPIEWTHHTFNPWWGCTKVSPACSNCYAELWAKRMGHALWGGRAQRRFFSDKHWNQPLLWNEQAELKRTRQRVFCASMADVFEARVELDAHRARLWSLIEVTSNLDWLLLTKRPENALRFSPWGRSWPHNVWLGTTVENEEFAQRRLPHLLSVPAAVRFLSCEPLLGAVNLAPWFNRQRLGTIDWVIAGGESGPCARPMHPDWATGLLRQCRTADVPFHFKQWGHWVPQAKGDSKLVQIADERPVRMVRLVKKVAGRTLEGRTWDGLPAVPTYA
jgi:protein gp37